MVRADLRVVDGGTKTYVRVQGTTGWLFTHRDGDQTLLPVDATAAAAKVQALSTSPGESRELRFSVADVRAVAASLGLREIQYNEQSRVIAFLKDGDDGVRARINVYYTTGTVGTALEHPSQGSTQLFRRGCNLQEVKAIMSNPRVHTNKGYKRRRVDNHADICSDSTMSEEFALRRGLREMDAELAKLAESRGKILEHLNEMEGATRASALAQAKVEAERLSAQAKQELQRARGKNYDFSLVHGSVVENMWDDNVKCVAMGGDSATLLLYDGGDYAYTAGLCTNLFNKLHHRGRNQPKPTYVAMGSMNRYYVRFENGKSEWVGPDGLADAINSSTSTTPSCVAFGEDWETYFVIFDDGSWSYDWDDIPSDIAGKLKSGVGFDFVSLGPAGEYFVQFKDLSRWGGMDGDGMAKVKKVRKRITSLHFGANNSWLVRYN